MYVLITLKCNLNGLCLMKAVEGINLPKEHTVTKKEDKILIQETGEATKNDM